MNALSQDLSGPDAADLSAASLAIARRLASGATLWCASPSWPSLARRAADDFMSAQLAEGPLIYARPVEGELIETLRRLARTGDVLVLVTRSKDRTLAGLRQRAAAWGLLTVWTGDGTRPEQGAADYVLWSRDEMTSINGEALIGIWQALASLTCEHLAHPERHEQEPPESTEEVCITCSDEGRLGEVVSLSARGQAEVRTSSGLETIDMTLIDGARPRDLVLIHAGTALCVVAEEEH